MRQFIATLLALVAFSVPANGQCCGDCDGNGRVTIDELIGSVNRALGVLECQAGQPHCPFDFGQLSGNQFCRYLVDAGGCQWVLLLETVPAANGATGNAVRVYAFKANTESYLLIGAFTSSNTAAGVAVIANQSLSPLFATYGGYVSMNAEGTVLHLDLGYDIEVVGTTGRLAHPQPVLAGCTLPGSLTAGFLDVFQGQ